jgi:general secretion pathway protein H
VRGTTPTSARGNSANRLNALTRTGRGFTLIELMVVMALLAIAVGITTLAMRDPSAAQLDREAVRLAALLEGARAESRSSGVAVRFEVNSQPGESHFQFIGLQTKEPPPGRWLAEGVSAEIIGKRSLMLGPEPLIEAQRIVLRLGDRNLTLATDGLGPFAPVDAATPAP